MIFISSADLDFMFLTESWRQSCDHSQLAELCLPDYFSQPKDGCHGGGLVTVYSQHFKCNLIACNDFFLPFKCSFLMELPEFVSSLVLNQDGIVLCGDFNIHGDESSNVLATHFF